MGHARRVSRGHDEAALPRATARWRGVCGGVRAFRRGGRHRGGGRDRPLLRRLDRRGEGSLSGRPHRRRRSGRGGGGPALAAGGFDRAGASGARGGDGTAHRAGRGRARRPVRDGPARRDRGARRRTGGRPDPVGSLRTRSRAGCCTGGGGDRVDRSCGPPPSPRGRPRCDPCRLRAYGCRRAERRSRDGDAAGEGRGHGRPGARRLRPRRQSGARAARLQPGNVPRCGQGQERFQALAAWL